MSMVYALVAVRKREKDSAEAGVKALVYGALSSGLMLYGISLLYGLGGSLDLREIGGRLAGERTVRRIPADQLGAHFVKS